MNNSFRIINFNYTTSFLPVNSFKYEKINDLVSYEEYGPIENEIRKAAVILNENKDSRKALIVFNNESCFTSIHFLISKDDFLYVRVCFRAQHETLGRPTDEKFICYLITKFLKDSKYTFYNDGFISKNHVLIVVNVGDYHNY